MDQTTSAFKPGHAWQTDLVQGCMVWAAPAAWSAAPAEPAAPAVPLAPALRLLPRASAPPWLPPAHSISCMCHCRPSPDHIHLPSTTGTTRNVCNIKLLKCSPVHICSKAEMEVKYSPDAAFPAGPPDQWVAQACNRAVPTDTSPPSAQQLRLSCSALIHNILKGKVQRTPETTWVGPRRFASIMLIVYATMSDIIQPD